MSEKFSLAFIDYVFTVADGDIKFLGQWFKTNTIDQPSFQDTPVALVVDVFVNEFPDLTVGILHPAPRQYLPDDLQGLGNDAAT